MFALSGSWEHRAAANVFCGTSQDALDRLFEPCTALTVFKNMSRIARPGLSQLWREHIKKRKGPAEGAAVVGM